jgi:hypothetical protein
MTDPDAVSRSPCSMGIGFNGWNFVDAYKVSIDPKPDLATNAIDNSDPLVAKRPKNRQGRDRFGENPLSSWTPTREGLAVNRRVPERVKKPPVIADENTKYFW